MFNFGKEKANDIKESNQRLGLTLEMAKASQAAIDEIEAECKARLQEKEDEMSKLRRELEEARAEAAKYQQEALEAKQNASALYERLVEDYSH